MQDKVKEMVVAQGLETGAEGAALPPGSSQEDDEFQTPNNKPASQEFQWDQELDDMLFEVGRWLVQYSGGGRFLWLTIRAGSTEGTCKDQRAEYRCGWIKAHCSLRVSKACCQLAKSRP